MSINKEDIKTFLYADEKHRTPEEDKILENIIKSLKLQEETGIPHCATCLAPMKHPYDNEASKHSWIHSCDCVGPDFILGTL